MNAGADSIRILAVDDHPIFREGLATVLATQPDMNLVPQASNGREAIQQFRQHHPDITLMDLQMPAMNGLEAMVAIRNEFPEAKITGSGWSRPGYAIGQTFWTHTDSGRMQFNYSEIVGNSTAVAISNGYYRDNRDAASAAIKLGAQVGVDVAANIFKEFSSDLNRKFFRKRHHDKQ